MFGKQLPYPLKRLGQNFLVSKKALKRVVEAARFEPTDTILEIGPGTGVLTREIAKKVKKVIAVEKDPRLVVVLEKTLREFKDVEIIQGDILKLKLQLPKTYKVIGNLPFYITAPVIRRFLESVEAKPQSMVLVVQKEVGQRICAKPPKMSILSNAVQFYAKPEIIAYLPKGAFWPKPKVDAAVIKITPKQLLTGNKALFFKIVKAGFSHPRKQLVNNLSKDLKIDKKEAEVWLKKNNISPLQRAETLNLADWQKLTKNYKIA